MTAPEHDPATCATCSPQIREERLRPIREAIADYLENLAESIRKAHQETP